MAIAAGCVRRYGNIVTKDDIRQSTSSPDADGGTYTSSFSRNIASSRRFPAAAIIQVDPGGRLHRRTAMHRTGIAFTLFADVQPILTDPEDGEALRIDDIRSVNLSERIGEGTAATSRSVIRGGGPTSRPSAATKVIEHLIALARAHLMKRARVVEIAFAPKLSRMPEITLRKNVFLIEPRVGEALGKIIGYSICARRLGWPDQLRGAHRLHHRPRRLAGGD